VQVYFVKIVGRIEKVVYFFYRIDNVILQFIAHIYMILGYLYRKKSMRLESITNDKFQNWINLLNKYGEEFKNPKTQDLAEQFFDLSGLIGTFINMVKGNEAQDEIEELKKLILIDLNSLYSDLNLYYEETPDEISKSALSDLYDHQNFFK
jgi:hypothetical protein